MKLPRTTPLVIAMHLVACGPGDGSSLTAVWPQPDVSDAPTWSTRCGECHDSGLPEPWAVDDQDVTAVTVAVGVQTYSQSARRTVIYDREGTARRTWSADGQDVVGEDLLGIAFRETGSEAAALTSAQWHELASVVSRSGLFRSGGEAATAIATHQPYAWIEVDRLGRKPSLVGSFDVLRDEEHKTFHAVLSRLQDLEVGLAWTEEGGR